MYIFKIIHIVKIAYQSDKIQHTLIIIITKNNNDKSFAVCFFYV